ncbi:MAG: mannose-1-phosphate guanylyltransferase, partial [Alphaproteobacteria bacterium HGW-Alphaproteobacteria-9]
MTAIHPVILCGGSGTRLWPVSRKAVPKPFLPLVSDETLFEQAVRRVAGDDRFAAPLVVAGAAHADLITAQLSDTPGARLVIEPAARNTAPAIALAAALLPPDAVMLVCPSDHHIADAAAFRAAALAAAELARQDYLVAFGIAPDRPETGYGYLQRGEPLAGGFTVARFVEKPDLARAQQYCASGDYSWNGGIFAFRAGHLLAELAAHRPDMARLVAEAVAGGREEGFCFYPAPAPFAAIDGDSIDYAVMENTARAAMVPARMGWSDIGNWAALADA